MRRVVLIVLIAWTAFSCARPLSRESFIRREKAGISNLYSFELDLSDSTTAYRISFYTRRDRKKPFLPFSDEDIRLRVRWISPSDSSYSEEAVLPAGSAVDSTYFFRDYLATFKQNFRPFEPGVWRVRVHVVRGGEDLLGLGIICGREE
jgi:hypothetical protein